MKQLELMQAHREQAELIRELETTRHELVKHAATGLLNRRAFERRLNEELALLGYDAPRALMFDNLGEHTLATAQLRRVEDPDSGDEPLLGAFLAPILGDCLPQGISVLGNFGAAGAVSLAWPRRPVFPMHVWP